MCRLRWKAFCFMGVIFMNEKELYYFYFDESNRNGNIRFKNGLPNFWHKSEGIQRETNYYVGCYLGWSANNRESALTEYQELEKQSKTMLFPGTDTELGELKSQKIRANYKYGLKTFTSKYIKFYTSLFNFLLKTGAIYQLNIISPFEILMSDGLEFVFKKPYNQTLINAFRYSITKFLQSYAALLNGETAWRGKAKKLLFLRLCLKCLKNALFQLRTIQLNSTI